MRSIWACHSETTPVFQYITATLHCTHQELPNQDRENYRHQSITSYILSCKMIIFMLIYDYFCTEVGYFYPLLTCFGKLVLIAPRCLAHTRIMTENRNTYILPVSQNNAVVATNEKRNSWGPFRVFA